MEKICNNCKHWERDKDYSWGRCRSGDFIVNVEIIIEGNATAHLDIEEDFGCIFFEEATDATKR